MPTSLTRDFEALGAPARFDLLIIGGGISGACLAWDAGLRGLKVALVEQGDFSSATTAASSKLIHGGLRYLKNGEVGLVRESLNERRILQHISPHQVRPLPFLIPTYKKGNTYWLIKAGMLAYDMLSLDRNRSTDDPDQRLPGHRSLSPAKVASLEPGVNPDKLTGGHIYHDCQCDPERHCLEFLLGAAKLGARLVNYARVESLTHVDKRLQPVELRDLLGGGRLQVEADMVVNLAGPWADHIDHLCGAADEVHLRRSKGIHLITRALVKDHTVVLRTETGRHFFIIPWRGHSLIGTTDTEYLGDLTELCVTEDDVEGFLDEINQAYPSAELKPEDVLYRYVGVRPLVEEDTQVYQASRKYEIVDHHRRGLKGYMSAIGGKYTTSRNLAKKICDRVLIHLDRPAVRCLTHKRLLPGGVPGRFTDWVAARKAEKPAGLDDDILEHLLWEYGAMADELFARVEADESLAERIIPGRPEIAAQVVHALESEMAIRLCDVMVRRTGLGTLGHPGPEAVDRVCAWMAPRLGWDAARIQQEKDIFTAKTLGQAEPGPRFQPADPA